jgi:hypothetical protein
MSPATTASTAVVPAHALRRGTRGFAAVVLFLTGLIVSAVTLFVLPSTALTTGVLTILIPLAIAFSIAHFVAVYGLIRRRTWSAPLTLYLAAIGLGLAAFGFLLLVTGLDPLGRPGAEAALESRVPVVGLLAWLAGSWVVAARFAVRGMAPAEQRSEVAESADPTRVLVAHPRVVAADAMRERAGLRAQSA